MEFGLGFDFSRQNGRDTRDEILETDGELRSNFSGGVDGGLTNGNPVVFRIALKPAVSFGKIKSVNLATGERAEADLGGRHDICFAQRVPPIAEAVSALVALDQLRIAGVIGNVLKGEEVL